MSQNLLIFTKYFEFQIFVGVFNGVRKILSCHNSGDQRVVCVVSVECSHRNKTYGRRNCNNDYTGRFRVAM
jgi:hypothetical protein